MFQRLYLFLTCFLAFSWGVSLSGPAIAASSKASFVLPSSVPMARVGLSSEYPVLHLAQSGERKKRKQGGKRRKKGSGSSSAGSGGCSECTGLEGFVLPESINDDIRKMVGKYMGGSGPDNVRVQRARGIIETGLYPDFIGGARCPEIDSEKWAIDYSAKRGAAALHRGVDIPQPRGTPIRAVSDGKVIGRFKNEGRKDGIAVVLRHTPAQTGLAFWTYSQYTHLLEMSPLAIGADVRMGEEIGKTSNSGKMGRRVRRDALHFAIFYSLHPQWSNDGAVVTPKDAYAMDPTAFYRTQPPYDSQSMAGLPEDQKRVPVPYMKHPDTFVPQDTKRIWPYPCT